MGYVNINGQARVFVQTGMDNTREDAGVSAQALSKALGGVSTGYINNGTEGLGGDVGEYLPNSLSQCDGSTCTPKEPSTRRGQRATLALTVAMTVASGRCCLAAM